MFAAGRLSSLLARPNLVAVDMGGTSYDVSVVQGGRVSVITQGEIDRLPVRLPMVENRVACAATDTRSAEAVARDGDSGRVEVALKPGEAVAEKAAAAAAPAP